MRILFIFAFLILKLFLNNLRFKHLFIFNFLVKIKFDKRFLII